MNRDDVRWDFYFITDSDLTAQTVVEDVEEALEAGCGVVQYREKERSFEEMVEEARALRSLCLDHGACLIINDDLDVAIAVDADGVHMGQGDVPLKEARMRMPDGIIGITCHTPEEALSAEDQGADYIGASAIFATTTKADAGDAIGLHGLEEISTAVALPIVAIGGIKIEHVPDLVRSGTDGVCAISATVGRPSVRKAVKRFLDLVASSKVSSTQRDTGG